MFETTTQLQIEVSPSLLRFHQASNDRHWSYCLVHPSIPSILNHVPMFFLKTAVFFGVEPNLKNSVVDNFSSFFLFFLSQLHLKAWAKQPLRINVARSFELKCEKLLLAFLAARKQGCMTQRWEIPEIHHWIFA